jgi:hypothetical protein
VHLPRADPEALAGLPRDPRKQRRRVVVVQPVQRSPQAVVVQHLRGDPPTQQVLHRFGREELGDQIQPSIAEPQPVQKHRHRRRAHAHLLLARSRQRIQIVC